MLPRTALILSRTRLSQPSSSRVVLAWHRRNSTGSPAPQQSGHTGFWKTFGRPIAKALLIATFTYQVVYWAWVKLEQDEIRADKEAEISRLESQVESLRRRPEK